MFLEQGIKAGLRQPRDAACLLDVPFAEFEQFV
jgi:hypothetical protein